MRTGLAMIRACALVLGLALTAPGIASAIAPHATQLTNVDLFPVPGAVNVLNAPVLLGHVLIYATFDDVNLYGLWASDGTSKPTLLARVDARELVLFRERVFFIGTDSAGTRLWTSDGSAAGTRPVAELGEGPGGFALTPIEGLLYVAGADSHPWRSDGTPQGTFRLSDSASLTDPPTPTREFLSFGGAVYFLASDDDARIGLWGTSGVPASTRRVADLGSSDQRFAYGLTSHGGRLYFFAAEEAWGAAYRVWASDGTAGGTTPLRTFVGTFGSVCPGQCFGIGPAEIPWNGRDFLFVADDGVHGRELWHTDGTSAGTRLLVDANPGPASGVFAAFMDPRTTAYGDGFALFIGEDDIHGDELWRTDGTAAGTVLLADLLPGPASSYPYGFASVGDQIFFSASETIWRTDGTASGTLPVRSGGAALWTLSNGFAALASDGLWTSDGSTFALADDLARPRGLQPVGLTIQGGALLFSRLQNNARFELWRFDPGAGPKRIRQFAAITTEFRSALGSVYFGADDGAHGIEPWITDGTEAGTRMLHDIAVPVPDALGARDSNPNQFTAAGGRIFFAAGDGAHGYELWTSDGTDAGTHMVRDFDPGYDGSVPGDLTSFRGSLAFTIAFPQPGGLWTTNGDPAGTNEVAPTTAWGLAAAGNSLFFVGSDAATGSELWRSDGTPQGTHLVLDILAGPGSPNIFGITPVGGRVFFRVQSPAGEDLWTSDGTPLGTRPLHAFRSMDELTSAGAFLYFTADDGEHGAELWRSDGTPEGTRLVADVAPGPASSSPASLTAVGDRILFAADDGIHGVEPWVSDGAPEGTKLLEDLSPGPASSAPAEFRDSGDVIYFRASREDVGAQLWSLPSSAIGPRPGERPRPTRILPPR